jgi:hypothetical protein
VELRADIPSFPRDFHNLYEVGGRVDSHTLHAILFILFLILVVKLIAVAVALADGK